MTEQQQQWLPDRPDHPFYTELVRHIEDSPLLPAAIDFRYWCEVDFWFFCRNCLSIGEITCEDPFNPHYKKRWLDHPWLFERCRDLQENPDGRLFKWPRGYFKSSLITTGLTLWDFIRDLPNSANNRVLIMTYKLDKIGEAFTAAIKSECENNKKLYFHWPELFWNNPQQESSTWTKTAITFKRQINAREPSVVVHPLDEQPTSHHFTHIIMDDAVTRQTVTNRTQVAKTFDAMQTATGLGSDITHWRYVGTSWAPDDPWSLAERSEIFTVDHQDCYDDKGQPVLRSAHYLIDQEKRWGSYNFCLAGDQRILMADWTHKRIQDVEIGDRVIGIIPGENGKKSRFIVSVVTERAVNEHLVLEYTLSDGKKIKCTGNHFWWTGRSGKDRHRQYAPLGMLKKCSPLRRVVDLVEPGELDRGHAMIASYISGMFDGEGSFTGTREGAGGTVHLTQTEGKNSPVCQKIRESFAAMGWDLAENRPKTKDGWSPRVDFYLRGGRQAKYEFLRYCNPVKHKEAIARSLMGSSGGYGHGFSRPVRAVSVRSLGFMPAYSITTTTGNYVSEGLVSKNSAQMRGRPINSGMRIFMEDWVQDYENAPDIEAVGKSVYMFVDPTGSPGKKADPDFCTIFVVGLGADRNFYALHMRRDRWSLAEYKDNVMQVMMEWSPKVCFIEERGVSRDVEIIQEYMRENRWRGVRVQTLPYEKDDAEAKWSQAAKERRIIRLQDSMSQLRWYFPVKHGFGYRPKGETRDLYHIWMDEEYKQWTPGMPIAHDDGLDTMAMILNNQLSLQWPYDFQARTRAQARTRTRRQAPASAWVS